MNNKSTLLETIRDGLFRCESFDEFKENYEKGYISPRDEKNPSKWPNRYAQHIGAVALFDFKTPSDEEFISTKGKWWPFFSIEFEPVAIAIALDWEALKPDLILYCIERFNESLKFKKKPPIPNVECWYPGRISLEHMTHLIVVSSFNTDAFRIIQRSENLIPEIESVMEEFQDKYVKPEYVAILEKAHKDTLKKTTSASAGLARMKPASCTRNARFICSISLNVCFIPA
jgi:hypothetical protein